MANIVQNKNNQSELIKKLVCDKLDSLFEELERINEKLVIKGND